MQIRVTIDLDDGAEFEALARAIDNVRFDDGDAVPEPNTTSGVHTLPTTPTAAPTEPDAPDAPPELDSTGTPWSEEIHASPPSLRKKDNRWRVRRGITEEQREAAEVELRKTISRPDTADISVPGGAEPTGAAAPTEPAAPPPPPPPATTAAVPNVGAAAAPPSVPASMPPGGNGAAPAVDPAVVNRCQQLAARILEEGTPTEQDIAARSTAVNQFVRNLGGDPLKGLPAFMEAFPHRVAEFESGLKNIAQQVGIAV